MSGANFMTPSDPNPDQEFSILVNFVESFGKAKWITGDNIVSPKSIVLHYTPLGQRRMRQIAKYSRVFYPDFHGDILKESGKPTFVGALMVWAVVTFELKRWVRNEAEQKILFALAVCYVKKSPLPPFFSKWEPPLR